MAEAPRKFPVRRIIFLVLQILVAAEAVTFAALAAALFVAAAGGDPTPLFVSTLLALLAGTLLYTSIALRSRGSTPFFATLVASLLGALILASTGSSILPWGIIPAAVILLLILLRNRFHLRPGEIVKEEKLPPDVAAKIATKIRGVRCRECGDDDVWITSDKLLVCRNCGTTNA